MKRVEDVSLVDVHTGCLNKNKMVIDIEDSVKSHVV